VPRAEGEIWQWAIGRNLWDDPALQQYARDLGTSWEHTDAHVQSQGFALTADGSGVVTAVTLFNDETALGLPVSETSYRAYQGRLPLGITWRTTADDLISMFGPANQSGGYGTSITFSYRQAGHVLEVAFAARHERDLPGSRIHSIVVREVPEG
jgi:hypothetical protein